MAQHHKVGNVYYLLLEDVRGLEPNNALLLRIFQKGKTTVTVKKGELVTPCREPVTVSLITVSV